MSIKNNKNTDREIYRKDTKIETDPDNYYSPKIFVTKGDEIGIDVGGYCIVKPIEVWHRVLKNIIQNGENIKENIEQIGSLGSCCLTYSHDYGLLSEEEQKEIQNIVSPIYDHHVKPLKEKLLELI